ncbi:MAG: c-type cytochrome [Rhodomicrobium sp.]
MRERSGEAEEVTVVHVLIASVFCMVVSFAGNAAHADDRPSGDEGRVARGHEIATMVCSACHAVRPAHSPILREPAQDLRSIANKPGVTAESLAAVLRNPAHEMENKSRQMPHPRLTDEMIDSVVAYLLSLRKGH